MGRAGSGNPKMQEYVASASLLIFGELTRVNGPENVSSFPSF